MYERMLNKKLKPTNAQIDDTLGQEAVKRLESLETFLTEHYGMGREIVFPFGNRYGWGYKYSQELWQKRYPCGERGGWLHYRVLSDEELQDVFSLIKAKVKPACKGTG